MPCNKMNCDNTPVREYTCSTCGRRFEACKEHFIELNCDCDTRQKRGRAKSEIDDGDVGSGQAPPTMVMTLDRSIRLTKRLDNKIAPLPNRLKVISINLQNFTQDHRMGRTNGAISSKKNKLRAAIVGALVKACDVDVLLVMETGSDVGAAMESIRRHAGKEYAAFVSSHTHATPKAVTQHVLQIEAPWVYHTLRLRLLTEVFDVEPSEPRQWSVAGALKMISEFHHLETWACQPQINPIYSVWIDLGGSGLPMDALALIPHILPKAPDQIEPYLRCLDEVRDIARFLRLASALHLLDILELLTFNRVCKTLDDVRACVTAMTRRNIRNRYATCAFLIFAFKTLTLRPMPGQAFDETEDADIYYEALRYLGCVDFHFETYGMLFRGNDAQRAAMLNTPQNWSILRLDENGRPLPTQQPGCSFNWRSAWRGVVPLPGGKWIEMLLFHTRFTPSEEALADKSEEFVVDRTLKMRADSVVSIGRFTSQSDNLGIPIVYFGDFNLPMNDDRDSLSAFAETMEDLGFDRYPEGAPLTTLQAPDSIAHDGKNYYKSAYDAAYVCDIPEDQVACRVLDIKFIADNVPEPILSQLRPYVAEYYDRLLNNRSEKNQGLIARLSVRRARLVDARIRSEPKRKNHDAFLTACRSLNAPHLACLLGDSAGFEKLIGAIRDMHGRFCGRDFFQDAGGGADPIAELLNQVRAVQSLPSYAALDATFKNVIAGLEKELLFYGTLLHNLDQNRYVRVAIGYELVVSDHLGLCLELDLDKPVGDVKGGSAVTQPGSSVVVNNPPLPPLHSFLPRPPESVDEFLVQQGRSADERATFQSELLRLNLSEGTATPVRHDCLLHTYAQLRAGGPMPAIAFDFDQQRKDLGFASGEMLEIGGLKFPEFLRENKICIKFFTLNLDGTLNGPKEIGITENEANHVYHVLHYGAHYVPLWRG